MTRQLNGMHAMNDKPWHHGLMCKAGGVGNGGALKFLHLTVVDDSAIPSKGDYENGHWIGKVRDGYTDDDGTVVPPGTDTFLAIRMYDPDWTVRDPVWWAEHTVERLSNWRGSGPWEGQHRDLIADPLVGIIAANEQNIEPWSRTPSAWYMQSGATTQEKVAKSRREYAWIGEWNIKFWERFYQLRPDRKCLSIWSALAQGQDMLWEDPDSEYDSPEIRAAIAMCDLFNTHPYGHADRPDDQSLPGQANAYWHLLRCLRPEGYRDEHEPGSGKPHDKGGAYARISDPFEAIIGECGTFAHFWASHTAETRNAFNAFYAAHAEYGRCCHALPFIWMSDSHKLNQIQPNEELRLAFAKMQKWVGCDLPKVGEQHVTDKLNTLLREEFGDKYDDMRDQLATNPDGPNGPFNTQSPSRFEGVAIHHSASSRNTTWHRVSEWHVNRQFAGIGYHLGIRNGRVAYLGDINTARAHVAGQNHRYVGVCVMGNYEDTPGDEPSGGDVALLHRLIGVIDAYLGHELPVVGHYQVPGSSTACPGDRLKPIVAALRDTVTPFPVQGIKDAADAAQAIEPNPTAALYNAIRGDGFWPISDEFTFEGYQCQLAREWQGESERIYFCLIPIWDQVGWIDRR